MAVDGKPARRHERGGEVRAQKLTRQLKPWPPALMDLLEGRLGSQPGGWITMASTPASSMRPRASSVVNDVTWRWAMLLGNPLPQR
jgi:hypothetical protein